MQKGKDSNKMLQKIFAQMESQADCFKQQSALLENSLEKQKILSDTCEFLCKENKRLTNFVNQLSTILNESLENQKQLTKNHATLSTESTRLNHAVHAIQKQINVHEQCHLESTFVINGLPEVENNPKELDDMVKVTLSSLNLKQEPVATNRVGRILLNGSLSRRPVEVKLKNALLHGEVKRKVPCNEICFKGSALGSTNQLIYLEEKLTPHLSHLLFLCRDLRRKTELNMRGQEMGKSTFDKMRIHQKKPSPASMIYMSSQKKLQAPQSITRRKMRSLRKGRFVNQLK